MGEGKKAMSSIIIGVIGIAIVLLLMGFGVPIGFSMILVGSVGFAYLVNNNAALQIVGVASYGIITNYEWLVLPLFFFLASILFYGGLGQSMFRLAYSYLGRLPGGLAMATIGAISIFSAISGSSIAAAVTIGTIALPEMKKYKYDDSLATACVAAGGTLDILIPPSGIFIIYGILTETSIVDLFVAGFVPGIILSLMFMGMIYIRVRMNPTIAPAGAGTTFREKMAATFECIDALVLIGLVLGGLIIGWFTPTEAAGVGAFAAIVASLLRRRLSWKGFKDSLWDTVQNTGMVFACLIGAFILTPFIAVSRIPMELAGLVLGFGFPPDVVMGLIVLVYLILGCFIDTMSMVLLTVPVFFPMIKALGYDPVWFGVIVVLVVEMAMVTPPVGMNVWVVSGMAKDVPMETIFKGVWPFVAVELLFVIILIAFPQIVLFLPEMLK
jgi:tripartite ATP-independent transporter DctM subunit